jgi:hypothetical protein
MMYNSVLASENHNPVMFALSLLGLKMGDPRWPFTVEIKETNYSVPAPEGFVPPGSVNFRDLVEPIYLGHSLLVNHKSEPGVPPDLEHLWYREVELEADRGVCIPCVFVAVSYEGSPIQPLHMFSINVMCSGSPIPKEAPKEIAAPFVLAMIFLVKGWLEGAAFPAPLEEHLSAAVFSRTKSHPGVTDPPMAQDDDEVFN